MGRRVRDSNLDSREARSHLRRRHNVYWRLIRPGLHLGFRKGRRGGMWIGRERSDGKYNIWRIGIADDVVDADGVRVLNFKQADDAVRNGPMGRRGDLDTVAGVMDYYLEFQRAEATAPETAEHAIEVRIKPALGGCRIANLSADKVRKWRDDLAAFSDDEKLVLKKKLGASFNAEFPERERRRKASVNRLLIVLKAGLNYIVQQGKYSGPTPWKLVGPYRKVEFTNHRFLAENEVIRLVNACDEDFRQLVRGAVQTGCRYGELIRMQVRNYDPDSSTITIARAKGGPRHVYLTSSGNGLFSEFTAGKQEGDLIFRRADGGAWGRCHQDRRMRNACRAARINPPISFRQLRTTYGATLARAGTPLQVIAAAMGHTDTRITEKHYAHLMPDYVSTTLQENLPTFGEKQSKVRRIKLA